MKRHFLRILLLLSLPAVLPAQDFLNGSFEKNGNLCLINASNTVFNANVQNTRAFGDFRNPDIASSDCGVGSAKEGNWFIGIATSTTNDGRSEAVALALTQALQKGKQYTLVFYTRSRKVAPNLEVAVSMNDSTQGAVIYTCSSKSIGTEWTEQLIRFNAPVGGKYITVKALDNTGNSGAWLDGFALRSIFVPDNIVKVSDVKPANGNTTDVIKTPAESGPINANIYPNPSTDGNFKIDAHGKGEINITVYNMLGTSIRQLTCPADSTAPTQLDLSGEQPGLYFVEMTSAGIKVTKRVMVQK